MNSWVRKLLLRSPNQVPVFDAATCARIKEERLSQKSLDDYRTEFIDATRDRFGNLELPARLFDDLSKTSPAPPFPVCLDDPFWELYGWDVEEVSDELNHYLMDALPQADWGTKELPNSDVIDIRVNHFVDLFGETRLAYQDTRRPSVSARFCRWFTHMLNLGS